MIAILLEAWPVLVVLLALLVASAFFSSSETAVFSLGPKGIADLRATSPRLGALLEGLLERKRRLLVTILLGNLVINVLYFNLGSLVAARLAAGGSTLAAVFTPLIVLAGIILVGEILPKMIAVRWPERVAGIAAVPLLWCEWALAGPRVLLGGIAEVLVRLLVGTRPEEGEVSPQELGALLRLAAEEGELSRDEHERLQAVLALTDTRVAEIMVPRVMIVGMPETADRGTFLTLARRHRHSKIPIWRTGPDDICGFVDLKQVLAGASDAPLEEFRRPVHFVPETANVVGLLERFRADEEIRVVIVVDEYGGTEGLVTREDLVEAVVGDIADEGDRHAPPVVDEGAGRWLVDARLPLRSLEEVLGGGVRDLQVRTVGGLVAASLGRVPRVGDRVRNGGIVLEVTAMRRRRPTRIRVLPATRRPAGERGGRGRGGRP